MASISMKRLCAVAAVLFASAASALAGDLNPPSWRGLPNSTLNIWGFADPAPIPQPSDFSQSNPALPPGQMDLQAGLMMTLPTWVPDINGRTGAWCLWPGEALCFNIENYNQDNPYKLIRLQVKYFNPETPPGTQPNPFSVEVLADVPQGGIGIDNPFFEPITPDGWFNVTVDIIIQPNPPREIIYIRNPKHSQIYIDQVVIDTICIPGAPAFGLAVVAGLAAFRRRRV